MGSIAEPALFALSVWGCYFCILKMIEYWEIHMVHTTKPMYLCVYVCKTLYLMKTLNVKV